VTSVDVVAIGASLGGLTAFETILRALPVTFDPVLILVQHRSPEFGDRLAPLLQNHCALPVLEPDDHTAVEGGRVYVAPANYHLLLDREVFWLSVDPPVWYARPSIDVTFESVAEAFRDRALCVMLTCGSEDGAQGALAVKRAGGRVYVQDPVTAEAPIGPRAVLARMTVDGVLSVDEIARTVSRLRAG
jgi:two-component system chemotaxis response regulator CheB